MSDAGLPLIQTLGSDIDAFEIVMVINFCFITATFGLETLSKDAKRKRRSRSAMSSRP